MVKALSTVVLVLAALATPAQADESSPLHAVNGVFPDVRPALPLSRLETRALRPLDHFKECDNCPEMVVVPAGTFVMGAPPGEEGSGAHERPQHPVTIAKPFAVGRFAVTFEQWDECAAEGICRIRPSDQSWGRGRRPVIGIMWDEAKDYVWWLSRKTGRTYRMLSEAEREYVTRAGSTTPFWWGPSILPGQANYDRKHDPALLPVASRPAETGPMTMPVDSFAPNPWGLYQLHGNVSDWVEDCWSASYDGAPSDGSARTDGNCSAHVLRGGAFSRGPQASRAAARTFFGGGHRMHYMSVRVARTLAD